MHDVVLKRAISANGGAPASGWGLSAPRALGMIISQAMIPAARAPFALFLMTVGVRGAFGGGAAATGAGGEGSFQLFLPAFSGIGTQSVGHVAKTFPGGIFGGIDPKTIHAANPQARAYRYQLGPYVGIEHVPKALVPPSHPFFEKAGTSEPLLPAAAIARQNVDGPNPGMATWPREFPPYLLTVPDDEAWLDYLTATVRKRAAGYDGVFVDSMGTAPVQTRYLVGKPVNPRSRTRYTVAQWLRAQSVMLGRVRQSLSSGQVLLIQGLSDGERYFGPDGVRPLLQDCDGAMAEMIYRGPQTPADGFPEPERWLQDVRMVADVAARGKSGFFWTKAWVPLSGAQRTQWLRFVLASHLLAAGEQSHFNFDSHNEPVLPRGRGNNADPAEYHAEYAAAPRLGRATEAMARVGATGAFCRRWQGGWVYVNPTVAPVTIDLAGRGVDLDGRPVGGPVRLPPHTGHIFIE